MKIMKNRKGFTLVELLVTITIMGILMILSLPQLSKLNNKDRKFEAYKTSLERAARLYVDSYQEDMFGRNPNGCFILKYSELEGHNLIKDFQEKDITCNFDGSTGSEKNTYIAVTKMNDGYRYDTTLYCEKNNTRIYSNSSETNFNNCNMEPDTIKPTISFTPDKSDWMTTKQAKESLKIKYTFKDDHGFLENQSIRYQFVLKPVDEDETPKVDSKKWKTINFQNKRNQKTISGNIPTSKYPTQTGEYYLYIDAYNVQDVVGNRASEKGKYTKSNGTYKFDNTPPTCQVIVDGVQNQGAKSGWYHHATFRLNSVDPHSGVAGKELVQDGYDDNETPKYSGPDFIELPEGRRYTYYGYVKDKVGNARNCSSPTISVDRHAPTGLVVAYRKWTKDDFDLYKTDKDNPDKRPKTAGSRPPYDGGWSLLPVIAVPHGATDNLGQVSYKVTVRGVSLNTTDEVVNYRNIIKSGTSTVFFKACDEANNCTNEQRRDVNVDHDAPKCTSKVYAYDGDTYSVEVSSWTKKSVKVKGTCTDVGSGCVNTVVKTDPYHDTTEKSVSPGDVEDKAGNKTTCDKKAVKVDKTDPECEVSYGKDTSSGVKLKIGCVDRHSGLKSDSDPSTSSITLKATRSFTATDKVGNSTKFNAKITQSKKCVANGSETITNYYTSCSTSQGGCVSLKCSSTNITVTDSDAASSPNPTSYLQHLYERDYQPCARTTDSAGNLGHYSCVKYKTNESCERKSYTDTKPTGCTKWETVYSCSNCGKHYD